MENKTKRILVADDEADVHEFIEGALEQEGVACIRAMDGEEALRKAAEEKPDLIILDVQMPRKDGFRVFSELRENEATRSVPVVMLTGVGERTGLHFSAGDMGAYLGKEPDAYVEKPVDPAQLQETVRKLLAGA